MPLGSFIGVSKMSEMQLSRTMMSMVRSNLWDTEEGEGGSMKPS